MTTTQIKAIEEVIIDPVCGMVVKPEETKLVSILMGQSYWFCADGCRNV